MSHVVSKYIYTASDSTLKQLTIGGVSNTCTVWSDAIPEKSRICMVG